MYRYIITAFFLLLSIFSLGQQTMIHQDNEKLFRKGIELIRNEQYAAAREVLEDYLKTDPDQVNKLQAKYYVAYAALRLYHTDGENLLNDFVENHPAHPKALSAYFELANFYFKDKKYRKAIEYYEKLDMDQLNQTQQTQARFKLGYAYFGFKEFDQAKEQFDVVKRGDNQYTHAASYYAGYIEYINKEYDQALYDFEKAEKNDSYAAVIPYLKANIYYQQERYDQLIEYGQQVLNQQDIRDREGINILIGDAYYQKRNYSKAIDYLEVYAENRSFQSNPDLYYKLAYAQYQSGEFEKASKNFQNVALLPDSLGQYASYYLGIMYLKSDQEQYAVTAFERASKSNHVAEIKEEATYQYAKVNFELGQYAEAISSLKSFISQYPESNYIQEANDLLGEAYLRTTNYDLAIEHIESLRNKSDNIKRIYQKVTFYKGTALFNHGDYREAVETFKKSTEYPYDNDILVEAYYWIGEAYSIGNYYDEAINAYANVFRYARSGDLYHLKARYGIGYAYYNTKKYDRALVHFKEYVNQLRNNRNKQFYNDALMRLADCYYVSKSYGTALDIYQQAIEIDHPEKDYAYYQIGVVQSLIGNTALAKRNFNTVINNFDRSRYHDDAIFEKAQVDFEEGKYPNAISGFTTLIARHNQSPLIPYAYMRRAIANYNLKNYDQTASDYKRILSEFITHEVANSALLGLQEVLTLQGESESFEPFLAQYKRANPENENLKNIEYESAKTLYYNQSYDKAIQRFQDYINQYPNNILSYEAKYFIAESYYRSEQIDQALDYYHEVVEENQTNYVNRAIRRIGELEKSRENWDQSVAYYRQLASIAQNKKEQYNAWEGLMENYFSLQKYDSVVYYANQILEKGIVNVNAQNKAYLYLGKAALEQNQYDLAIDHFINTLNTAKDENGAEAQFLMAEIFYLQGKFRQSIETLYDLNENFSMYEKWISKSFLLIADNYYALDEIFQAKATLNSLIEKSPVEEVKEEAREKLKKIEEEEQEEIKEDTSFMQPMEEDMNPQE